jgi:ParB/RepB/Spo0J family partition protein
MTKKFNIDSKRFNTDTDALDNILNKEGSRLVKLSHQDIDTWALRDRKDFELGNIDELALSIKNRGQAQPIVVTKANNEFIAKNDSSAKYIVIAGYRRWLACKQANIKIDAIIKTLTFDQAVECLKSENEKEGVSDYSNGMFYYNLKKNHDYTLDKLSKNLGIEMTKLHRLISFAEVPSEIWNAINDMKKVSARTSAEILAIINKNPSSVEFFIEIANKIRDGAGTRVIKNLFSTWKNNKVINKTQSDDEIYISKYGIIKVDVKELKLDNDSKEMLLQELNLLFEKYKGKNE